MFDHIGFVAKDLDRLSRDMSYTYYAADLIDPDGNNIEAGVRG